MILQVRPGARELSLTLGRVFERNGISVSLNQFLLVPIFLCRGIDLAAILNLLYALKDKYRGS